MATTAPGSGADRSVADELRRLGVKGVLVQMAERGQLLALKREMPQCYHHKVYIALTGRYLNCIDSLPALMP